MMHNRINFYMLRHFFILLNSWITRRVRHIWPDSISVCLELWISSNLMSSTFYSLPPDRCKRKGYGQNCDVLYKYNTDWNKKLNYLDIFEWDLKFHQFCIGKLTKPVFSEVTSKTHLKKPIAYVCNDHEYMPLLLFSIIKSHYMYMYYIPKLYGICVP